MKDTAAIILCAGKGSRMKDNSKSKVCFDCAGIPVIRRIIDNMKQVGGSRFVVVIGHQAYSVMDSWMVWMVLSMPIKKSKRAPVMRHFAA